MIKTAFFTLAEWAYLNVFYLEKRRESKKGGERKGEKGKGEKKRKRLLKKESQKQ